MVPMLRTSRCALQVEPFPKIRWGPSPKLLAHLDVPPALSYAISTCRVAVTVRQVIPGRRLWHAGKSFRLQATRDCARGASRREKSERRGSTWVERREWFGCAGQRVGRMGVLRRTNTCGRAEARRVIVGAFGCFRVGEVRRPGCRGRGGVRRSVFA